MLDGKQRSYLRSKANKLDTLVHVGKEGINQAVIKQVNETLADHELIKVKILESVGRTTRSCAEELATVTESQVVQTIGGVAVLFRQDDEDSKYRLP